jgi:hypothetical protein
MSELTKNPKESVTTASKVQLRLEKISIDQNINKPLSLARFIINYSNIYDIQLVIL